ncbi:MAG: hypothetical protein Q7T56_03640 [Nocardioidaceae bacterium]|nr:hypothetical protein [Nocardioidaceae bacterium]
MKQDKDDHAPDEGASGTATRTPPPTAGELAAADGVHDGGHDGVADGYEARREAADVPVAEPGPTAEERRAHRRERTRDAARRAGASVSWVRTKVAQVVWLVALACAVVLGVGALLVALDANAQNAIVSWVLDRAAQLDGPFIDVFTFSGDGGRTKQTLVGWGLAAIAYLVVGRLAERIIKP